MRHGAGKNETAPVNNHTQMKVPTHPAAPCVGGVHLHQGSNGDPWKIMTPGTCVPSAGTSQIISPLITYDPGNHILRSMIAQDVNLVSKTGVQKYVKHSRKKTRVASLPDGTVQITFRRMVPADNGKQGRPTYQIPILPKSIIKDLQLCPLSNKKGQPAEPPQRVVTSLCTSTNTLKACASTMAEGRGMQPLSSFASSSSLSSANPSTHNEHNGLSEITRMQSHSFSEVEQDLLSETSINSISNVNELSSSIAGIASIESRWNDEISGHPLNSTKNATSFVVSSSSHDMVPSCETQASSSEPPNTSLSETSLEEDLTRDLQEMCSELFSPTAMDVDAFPDETEYFGQPGSLSRLFECQKSQVDNISIAQFQSTMDEECRTRGSSSPSVSNTGSSTCTNIPFPIGGRQPVCVDDPILLNEQLLKSPSLINGDELVNNRSVIDNTPDICTEPEQQFTPMQRKSSKNMVAIEEMKSHSNSPGYFADSGHFHNEETNTPLRDIVDISPEVSSTQGGGKIIIIGAWNNKDVSYSCTFGDLKVSAELVQHGVLRCFCPAHPAGKVPIQVFRNEVAISKPVIFEYMDADVENETTKGEVHSWLSIDEDDLRRLLIERINGIVRIVDPLNTLASTIDSSDFQNNNLENLLCKLCDSLSQKEVSFTNIPHVENSMTILHLSAALGFTQLIQTLCTWSDSNEAMSITSQEADPIKRDQFGWLPLFWACSKGRFDTVCVLLQWNETTSSVKDRCGCTALSIVRDHKHVMLVKYLEKFHDRSASRDKGKRVLNHSTKHGMLGSPGGKSPLSDSSHGEQSRWETSSSLSEVAPPFMLHSDAFGPFDGSFSSSRTLARTLAQVQAIIQNTKGDPDRSNPGSPCEYVASDDESLFDVPPFTPSRSRNAVEDLRGPGASTPRSSVSSLSPGSPNQGGTPHSPFDPSSHDTAEFCEFFYNSKDILAKDFAELTLTDQEQQELYRAASIIQKAYKAYRERRRRRDHELQAATLIQSYYRRYKQYASFKKMQKGALLIQSQFRAHREERKKSKAAAIIQTYYRRYKERKDANINIQERNRAQQDSERRASRFFMQSTCRLRDFHSDFGPK